MLNPYIYVYFKNSEFLEKAYEENLDSYMVVLNEKPKKRRRKKNSNEVRYKGIPPNAVLIEVSKKSNLGGAIHFLEDEKVFDVLKFYSRIVPYIVWGCYDYNDLCYIPRNYEEIKYLEIPKSQFDIEMLREYEAVFVVYLIWEETINKLSLGEVYFEFERKLEGSNVKWFQLVLNHNFHEHLEEEVIAVLVGKNKRKRKKRLC